MTTVSSMLAIYNQSIPFLQNNSESFDSCLRLTNDSRYFIEEVEGVPAGFAVINQNSILALCVSPKWQNRGIGTKLLREAENGIYERGHSHILLGRSNQSYLFQGVPYIDFYNSCGFFEKHGYAASWSSIDMSLSLIDFSLEKIKIPAVPDNITFRYAEKEDQEILQAKVFGVNPSWCKYYIQPENEIYLVEENGEIVGFVLICKDNMSFSLNFNGRVGGLACLGVIPEKRNRGIGIQLAAFGTHELKLMDCNYSYLGYTWLEEWYGALGYKSYAVSGWEKSSLIRNRGNHL